MVETSHLKQRCSETHATALCGIQWENGSFLLFFWTARQLFTIQTEEEGYAWVFRYCPV